MMKDLIRKSRSYRRFHQELAINLEILRDLVNLARLSPSGNNMQPLRYILSCEPEKNASIFPHLAWAGYLKGWPGPSEGEKPSAYIVILNDTEIRKDPGCDHGIAAQSMLLGAAERGLGGCMIGSIERVGLRKALDIAPRYEILLTVALGKPKEKIVLDPIGSDGSIKYWRDDQSIHHVPKRSLDELILE